MANNTDVAAHRADVAFVIGHIERAVPLVREGAVIFDESSHGRLHFLARSLALASRRPGALAGNVHVKIGAGATLEVIPVDTTYGCLVLGAVVPEALDPPAVLAVMEALALVAAPPVES